DAENYVRWIFSELAAPHLGRRVLEIGSGIGTYSSSIATDANVERLTCVEVEPRLVDAARNALAAAKVQKPVDHIVGDYLAAPLPKDHFDTALLINVLEHLRDDRAAVRKARSELRMDGRLVIFVPAFELLMSDLDRRLGHYRRYTTGSLRRLLEGAGFTVTALRYYNLTGFLGWLWRFRILGRTEQSRALVRFFDRVVLPVQLRVERTLELPVGQSVYAVAKKR
ncbi:MAG TPA: methyltransferase domain-containing protein, partial [Candidatus Limnocylindria bacterium]|nr:methyltransferase domain-containing protein [Candidatus Limnocylindria bacterium]